MKNKAPLLALAIGWGILGLSCYTKQKEEREKAHPLHTPISVKGQLIIGHEVSSFQGINDTTDYWIYDSTGTMDSLYWLKTQKDSTPYTPISMEAVVIDEGKASDGFPEDYASVYRVLEIISMGDSIH